MAEAAEKPKVTTLRPAETARAEGAAATRPSRARIRDRKSRRQLVRWTLLLGGPILVVMAVGWFWLTGGRYGGGCAHTYVLRRLSGSRVWSVCRTFAISLPAGQRCAQRIRPGW